MPPVGDVFRDVLWIFTHILKNILFAPNRARRIVGAPFDNQLSNFMNDFFRNSSKNTNFFLKFWPGSGYGGFESGSGTQILVRSGSGSFPSGDCHLFLQSFKSFVSSEKSAKSSM